MKTKIIYISGNEVFEMSEIRAAFEEVRAALGLDDDTILFGVPVDADNALADGQTAEQQVVTVAEPVVVDEELNTTEELIAEPVVIEDITESETDVSDEEINIQPSELDAYSEESYETPAPQPEIPQDSEKVIPILSVLAMTQDAEPESNDEQEAVVCDKVEETVTDTVVVTPVVESDTEIITDVNVDDELVAPNMSDENMTEKVTISDMINDEAPVAQMEKTLEQLLESMTPLREDVEHENNLGTNDEIIDSFDLDDNNTDATLAQLASEFAENEDKIVATKISEPQGKIGKLKIILPFKKAKRDDNGLMGDLFGWAGIAANDEDFTMPGFFAGAKKQGA
ncbi:MAG: hypothetical protein J6S12_00990 [Alphaproteobacteria bacterium]|nr:hypothetical protein [Alphaproteobacteria bacterium]